MGYTTTSAKRVEEQPSPTEHAGGGRLVTGDRRDSGVRFDRRHPPFCTSRLAISNSWKACYNLAAPVAPIPRAYNKLYGLITGYNGPWVQLGARGCNCYSAS